MDRMVEQETDQKTHKQIATANKRLRDDSVYTWATAQMSLKANIITVYHKRKTLSQVEMTSVTVSKVDIVVEPNYTVLPASWVL